MQLLAAACLRRSLMHVVTRLGGPGLIALGLVDNSVIPLPGGMDAATILLAAAHHEPWWYYAIMATVGSLIGGYLTYRLGLKGGEETLQKKLSKRRADQVSRIFQRFGFWSSRRQRRDPAADADRTHPDRCRSPEISSPEILVRAGSGPRRSLPPAGLSGAPLRAKHSALAEQVLSAATLHPDWIGSAGERGRALFLVAK